MTKEVLSAIQDAVHAGIWNLVSDRCSIGVFHAGRICNGRNRLHKS